MTYSRSWAAVALAVVLEGCGGSRTDAVVSAPGGRAASGGSSGAAGAATGGRVGTGGVATGGAGPGGAAGTPAGSADAAGMAGAAGSAGAGGRQGRDGGVDSSAAGSGGAMVCGTTWKNPIAAGAHDPTLTKSGDTYFVYSTATSLAAGARLVPFATSTDRVHWTDRGNLFNAIPAWAASLGLTATAEIWAPDVHLVNGKYFLYYSVSAWGDITHSAIGLMTATALAPGGTTWTDHGKVIGSPEGGAGVDVIDPDLFVDDDGSWWLVYGSFRAGIRLVPLDPSSGLWTRATAPVPLTTSLGEGSDIIKNNGYYYLFVSRGTCCAALSSTYEVVYGRASKVTGPYLNKNGASIDSAPVVLLPHGTDGNPGQGGQSFFQENGQVYMVYHAYQPPSGQPVLDIRPIYFDASDWVTLDPCLARGSHP